MARRAGASETAEEIQTLHPKYSERLIAHQGIEKQLLAWITAGRLPHAILLTGARGIGKATLAYRLARFLLAPAEPADGLFGAPPPPESFAMKPEHPTFRRVAMGAHPDFMALEADDIKIEEARSVATFLSLTPAESDWRVVIIDSADAMNRNAANALLKTLEEPPARAVLVLISHNPGNLLPTIRSRCLALRMQPLDAGHFSRIIMEKQPDISSADSRVWSLLSGGSPGVALSLIAQKADALYRELLERMAQPDILKLHAFAERFARKDADAQWQVIMRLLPWLLARIAASGFTASDEVFGSEHAIIERLRASKPLDLWTELWEKAGRLMTDAERLHLDRKQVIITLLRTLSE